jgi:hypothetical protein
VATAPRSAFSLPFAPNQKSTGYATVYHDEQQRFTRSDLHKKKVKLHYTPIVLYKSHNNLALSTETFSTISCIMVETSLKIPSVMSETYNKFLWIFLSPKHWFLAQP